MVRGYSPATTWQQLRRHLHLQVSTSFPQQEVQALGHLEIPGLDPHKMQQPMLQVD